MSKLTNRTVRGHLAGFDRADLRAVQHAVLAVLLTAAAGVVGFALAESAHGATLGLPIAAALAQIDLQAGPSDPSVPVAPLLSHLVAAPNQQGVMTGVTLPMPAQLRARVLLRERLQVFDPQWNTQAVFVVGLDEASLAWLERNHHELLALDAVGLVDGVPSAGAFKALQAVADGLALAPLTGTWFQQRLRLVGADLVPLLILADGRAVQRLSSQTDLSGSVQPVPEGARP